MISPNSQLRSIKIDTLIGEGGMGLVYKGFDTNLNCTVAVKALRSDFTRNQEMLSRFQGEGQIQAQLGDHPNIVPVYDFFEEDDGWFLVMEYIEGETLQQLINRVGLVPPNRGLKIFKGILSATAHAHSKNIVHRDIKPSNVMVTSKDEAQVMDFGIAKQEGSRGFTQTGGLVGSFHYMAPELFKGQPASKQSDVWSLGVTLFEILTGHLPFEGKGSEDIMSLIMSISRDMTPSPQKYYPYVPNEVETAVMDVLTKDPSRRIQSAEEFEKALKGTKIKVSGKTSMVQKIDRVVLGATGVAPCPSCGVDNALSARFCLSCGSSTLSPCPSCGEETQVTAVYCGQCGIDKVKYDKFQAILDNAQTALTKKKWEAVKGLLADAEALAIEWVKNNSRYLDITDLLKQREKEVQKQAKNQKEFEKRTIKLEKLYKSGDWDSFLSLVKKAPIHYKIYLNENVPELDRKLIEVKKAKSECNEFLHTIEKMDYGKILDQQEKHPVHIEKFSDFFKKFKKTEKIISMAKTCPSGMVLVAGGRFQMGSNEENDEKPIITVTVSSFFMDKTVVTQAQYIKVMGKNPSHFSGNDDRPVENVSWHDANEYANKVGKRLPTEAEWEYAARGGNKPKGFIYAGSNNIDEVAWHEGNSGNTKIIFFVNRKTHPIAQKQPNALGLYDMSGNVREWCSDWYVFNFSNKRPRVNPHGPNSGYTRVLRGGSWNLSDTHCRVANRYRNFPDRRSAVNGFRLVRSAR